MLLTRIGFISKTRKTHLLFSITYPDKNKEHFPNSPQYATIFMKANDLLADRHHPDICYVDENKIDSYNTPRSKSLRSHDVYGGKGFSQKWPFLAKSHVIENRTGSVLASKNKGFEATMSMKQNGLASSWHSSLLGMVLLF
jgi:hypothetical protein